MKIITKQTNNDTAKRLKYGVFYISLIGILF